jgi:predicted RNA-binding Zn-ribbon protein involved in translation (DUF1610 family)
MKNTIEFYCERCTKYQIGYSLNIKDDTEVVECSECGYENTLKEILKNKIKNEDGL